MMDEDIIAILIVVIVLSLFGLMLLTAMACSVLVIRDTVRRRGKWGINTKPVYCPACGEPAPVIRVPKNRRQALWGGCTCVKCGLEYDKWGWAVDQSGGSALRSEN